MPVDTVAVLPAYKLEDEIAEIVERTLKQVDVVIVTTDGSPDDTAGAAERAGAVVPTPTMERGKGYALIKGIAASRDYDPKVVVVMDADGQHIPEEIPFLTAPVLAGVADMCVGSRMLGTLRTSTLNKFGNVVLKAISFAITRRWLTDTESGFRAFDAQRLYELSLNSRGYEVESELLLKALHKNFKVIEVPIHVPKAVPGATAADGVKVAWYKIKTGINLRIGRERA